MSDLIDLVQHMYNFFQQKYGRASNELGPGSVFLSFEKLAAPVFASDFKQNPTDTEFNPAFVLQKGASLVDFAARLDPEGFIAARGSLSPTVAGQYKLLLYPAQPISQSGSGNDVGFFLVMHGEAKRLFEAGKRNMDLSEFWPASFTPQFWFYDQDLWSQYKYSAGESSESGTGATPPPVILGNWNWHLLTAEVRPKWEILSQVQTLTLPEMLEANVLQLASPASGASFSVASSISGLRGDPETVAPRGLAINTQGLNREASTHSQTRARRIENLDILHSELAQANPIHIKQAALDELVSNLPVQQVSSSNFNLSFDYLVVDFARSSWLSADFLTDVNWYIPGLRAGDFASGTYENNDRRFAFLPDKFIAIKNLHISAQWSEEDRTFAQNAASFGPFSLIEMKFENDTLISPGMQIFAWFCEIMPMLPPKSDPALA